MTVEPFSPNAIGARIRMIRAAFGLTQSELGALCGVEKNAVSNWENGRAKPTIVQLQRLVLELSLTLDWIYLGHWQTMPAGLAARLGIVRPAMPDRTDPAPLRQDPLQSRR